MKNDTTYGLIRHVDELGRIVVPKEIRKQLNISETDAVEISLSSSGRSHPGSEHTLLFSRKPLPLLP